MSYRKPHLLYYRITQVAAWCMSHLVFRRKFVRNEIRGKKGGYVVIANHQTALDFVNLIGATSRPMSFVISKSFYNALPVKKFMTKIGVIPKQQFQTAVSDLKTMRAVIEAGMPLVIYPAGLMCEDGLSTPIPSATYKFLKWLDTDVYMARTTGSYFVAPKWTKGMRPGRTYMDIYQLFSRQELAEMDVDAIKQRAEEALLFDAYREQEDKQIPYWNNQNVEGLQNVLYQCPHCGKEHTIVACKNTLTCSACGYEQVSDRYAMLHNKKELGPAIRYVSDWSTLIHQKLKEKVRRGEDKTLSTPVTVRMFGERKHGFTDVGNATLSLSPEGIQLQGTVCDAPIDLQVSLTNVPTLPFSPGRYLEVQNGKDIYRCVPTDGRIVMKCIHLIKIFYELRNETAAALSD